MVIVTCVAGFLEFGQLVCDFIGGEGLLLLDKDLLVAGLLEVVCIDQEFFIEFLAGTKACFDNLYVMRTHEANHAFCKVHNLDGLAHIKDKQVSVLGHGARGKNKLAGFGNGHEVSDYLLQLEGYKGAVGELNIDENGIVISQAITKQIKNGKAIKVEE